tara:strand:+ start:3980 stop:4204 length:225 start_codon:yes stop_codon:yes gene_type:complete
VKVERHAGTVFFKAFELPPPVDHVATERAEQVGSQSLTRYVRIPTLRRTLTVSHLRLILVDDGSSVATEAAPVG